MRERALRLYATGLYGAAAAIWQEAVVLGDACSHAELAWLLIHGRQGVEVNETAAFQLAQAGAVSGCMHSCGVLACCFVNGDGCSPDMVRGLQLARDSAAAGSKYGQFMLGELYRVFPIDEELNGSQELDLVQAVRLVQMAAAQCLDEALCILGILLRDSAYSHVIVQDDGQALQLFKLAAEQGFTPVFLLLGECYEEGRGVAANVDEAAKWYILARRAVLTREKANERLSVLGVLHFSDGDDEEEFTARL
jgi:TPR repeat protein